MNFYPKETHEELLWQSARQRAKTQNLPFNITVNDVIIPDECPYLKVPMCRKTMTAPSVDKIIPELGYVKGNIEIISRKANLMKSNATNAELLEFAYTILERN